MCTISTPNLLYKDSNLNRYLNKTKPNESISCTTLNNKNDTNKIRAKINNFMLWKKPIEANKRIHINCWKTVKTRQELWLLFKPIQSTKTTFTRSNHSVVWHLRDLAWCWWYLKRKTSTIWHFYVICRQTKIRIMPLLEHTTCIHRITIERRLDFHSDKIHYMRWFHLIPNTITLFLRNLWSKYLLFFL